MAGSDDPGTGLAAGAPAHRLQTTDPDTDSDEIEASRRPELNDPGRDHEAGFPGLAAVPAAIPATAAADDPADKPADEPLGRSRIGLFAGVAGAALSLDIVSKVLVVAKLSSLEPKRLLGGAVYLVLARNGGAAFSVGPGATVLFTAVAVIVVGVLVRVASRLRSIGWAVALGLVLGGALGNLIDRLTRAPGFGRGHVIDWISLFSRDGHVWPIFNLADSAIVTGGVLGAVLAVLGVELNGRRPGPRRP